MAEAAPPRLLTVTVGAPHPTRGASIVLFWHYVMAARRAGWHIRHLAIGTEPALAAEFARSAAAPGVFDVDCVEEAAPIAEGLRDIRIDVARLAPALSRARAFGADAILAFDLPAAWAVDGVDAPQRVVWAGDLMFDVVRYHALYAAREDWRRWPHSLLRLAVARRWKDVYARVLGRATGVVASSFSSVAKLAELGVRSEFQAYPWPDPGLLAHRAPPEKPSFVFFGNLAALGSRSALHFMIDGVIPRLREIWGPGGFEIGFAGTGTLPGWAATAFARTPEAKPLGFVADLGALLARTHAAIAPIEVPVGNRTRILTAMAYGVPVVAHANAALGNPDLVDRATCFLAGDAAEFAEKMRLVVEAPDLAARVAAAGRAAYAADYLPEAACARFASYLDDFKPKGARAA